MKLATGGVFSPCSNPLLQGSNNGLFSSNSCALVSNTRRVCGSHSNLSLKANSSWNSEGSVAGQCLASNAARIKDKWMEFQGIKNWEGLLDPLDDGLRDEILRYGEFVEAAYRCFDFDTSSPGYATCRYPKGSMLSDCGVGVAGYKVTKSLHATCGVSLPDWTERIPAGWVSTQSSWIGYVAVCNDKAEIARLGRRDVVIAYRGTATCMEWIENLRANLTCLPCDMAPDNCQSMVQSGFLSLYTSRAAGRPSLQDSIRGEIDKILQKYADEPLSITVTGHSLGAALATLTAHDINTTFRHAPLVTVVSFGGPRVGNKNFRRTLERNGTKVLRIVNSDDPITKVPGFVLEENAPQRTKGGGGMGLSNWLQKRMEDTQWVYAEVGNELRLSSRDCPHLSNGSVATCHDLKTYLHLVDNFVVQIALLRATAKRVIEQTSGEATAFV
ncbi:Alpha/beta-Hydrolases superfamily protein [Dorcoceras hygrometricum]|uniref:Alpha/beta-Hydrolases superfamily protein n=1 Tax=Dorcoceras hygrometricum TaxID=472368 RepID=A0A2Z7CPQ2_9LAMI|nr:Alpha/beta-Hydrolases superfamily protein [Dorcoceras hygrometricum]